MREAAVRAISFNVFAVVMVTNSWFLLFLVLYIKSSVKEFKKTDISLLRHINILYVCTLYVSHLNWLSPNHRSLCARLAQSVEHETLNLGVVGSSPTLGDINFLYLFWLLRQNIRCNGSKSFDPDETRTRNLLIRSQTPYPLGHGASYLVTLIL